MRRAVRWGACLGSALALAAAAHAKEVGGLTKELVLSADEETVFTAPVRCKRLIVRGEAVVRAKGEQPNQISNLLEQSSWNNDCGKIELPNSVKIACDEVVFESGAELHTWSHLRLFSAMIRGPATVVGLRSRAGGDAKPIDISGDALHGKDGANGDKGDDGQDAGSSTSKPLGYSAEEGKRGGDGTPGEHGKGIETPDRPGRVHAQDGSPGQAGEHNVCVTVQAENFDGTAPIRVSTQGGQGGRGGDGQNGGNGGKGGNGGRGGEGGDSDTIGGRSRNGGDGGNGKNGGNASDGGRGGMGGRGGDGGRIEVVIQEDQDGKGTRPMTGSVLDNFGGPGGPPGVGGRGGKGGKRGERGEGGTGGDGDKVLYNAAHTGGAGHPGDEGKDGKDGLNGTWGDPGDKGETVENIFGYGSIRVPSEIDWDTVNQ